MAHWVSLDPRMGDVVFYPAEVARRIEAAHAADRASVELSDFHEATVHFKDYSAGGRPIYAQTTPADYQKFVMKQPGFRTVARLEALPAVLHARRIIGEWRLCHAEAAERTLQVVAPPLSE
jgi:hypothetical protein